MGQALATVAIGLLSGVLSGLFGIGGGIVTTPAIRLFLDAPALVAVGTPLVAIIPSTITGARSYQRAGLADLSSGLVMGFFGSLTAVVGAWLTKLVGGSFVLIATAALILYVAADMALHALRPPRPELVAAEEADAVLLAEQRLDDPAAAGSGSFAARPRFALLLGVGALTGLYSGFLGLGGGFVLVPLLVRWMRFPLKRAIGTSLVAISVLSVPGAITHALLGNVDWTIALALIVGVVPGAMLGARIAIGSSDRSLRLGFAAMLAAVGTWLAVSEIIALL